MLVNEKAPISLIKNRTAWKLFEFEFQNFDSLMVRLLLLSNQGQIRNYFTIPSDQIRT